MALTAGIPKHLSISEQLRQWILSGQYLPGDQLPSEHKLMAQFEVSRITIRRALSNLAQQGLVVSQHGKGVFVKERGKVTYSLSSPLTLFDEDMARQGVSNSITNIVYELVTPSPEVKELLRLSSLQEEVYFQKN